jgi:hypothetical protein
LPLLRSPPVKNKAGYYPPAAVINSAFPAQQLLRLLPADYLLQALQKYFRSGV